MTINQNGASFDGASTYGLVPFDVPAGASYDSLSLRMMYDAGVVADVNGQGIARANAPAGALSLDALATSEHPEDKTSRPPPVPWTAG